MPRSFGKTINSGQCNKHYFAGNPALRSVQTGRVKRSGLACFGRVCKMHWIRKISILVCFRKRMDHRVFWFATRGQCIKGKQCSGWKIADHQWRDAPAYLLNEPSVVWFDDFKEVVEPNEHGGLNGQGHYWANFHCCKWQNIEKLSNHLVTLVLTCLGSVT